MLRDRIRITNRRMIFLALLVWLGTQTLFYLEPLGAPRFLASSLIATGLVALPALLLWPWLKRGLLQTDRKEQHEHRISGETRNQALVSAEIAALSALLIFLLTQVPR